MRKPRDFDTELKALTDRTKSLKENKRKQLGELIMATGADALDIETLAGGLLAMVESADKAQKEAWRKQGTAFFRGKEQISARNARGDTQSTAPGNSGPPSA